jgi:hypothetical protein
MADDEGAEIPVRAGSCWRGKPFEGSRTVEAHLTDREAR